jgi:hypothetical protein
MIIMLRHIDSFTIAICMDVLECINCSQANAIQEGFIYCYLVVAKVQSLAHASSGITGFSKFSNSLLSSVRMCGKCCGKDHGLTAFLDPLLDHATLVPWRHQRLPCTWGCTAP